MDPMTIVSGWSGKASTNRKSILVPLGTPKVKHKDAKRQPQQPDTTSAVHPRVASRVKAIEAAAAVANNVDRSRSGSAPPPGNKFHEREGGIG